MEKIKNSISKILRSDKLSFIIFFIILICIHINIDSIYQDDRIFSNVLRNGNNLAQWLTQRYFLWSSRIVIEMVLVIILQFKLTIWKILNILMYLILAISISKIVKCENKKILNWVICIFLLLIPINVINGTGWAATTTNYLWVVSLGLFSLSIIKDYIDNTKIKTWKYPIYIITTIYASNQEQMAVSMFLVIGIFLIYQFKKKKMKYILENKSIIIFQFIIVCLSILFILICPGNEQRGIQEIGNWYPEYEFFNIIEKIELAITSTMQGLILKPNYIFILFTLILWIGVCKQKNEKIYKILLAIPFISSIAFTIFKEYTQLILPNLKELLIVLNTSGLLMKFDEISFVYICIICLYIFILSIIPLGFYLIYKKNYNFYIATIIYLIRNINKNYYGIFSNSICIWRKNIFVFVYIFYNM